jgi:hypothetical protein
MLPRALLGWGVLTLATALGACGSSSSVGAQDAGPIPCTDDNQCPSGYNCTGGYCQSTTHPDAATDAPLPAEMLVSPTLLDFGSPYVGGEYVKSFTIANVGVADLTIASLNLIEDRTNGAYQVSAKPVPFVIAGGAQETVNVTLRPNDENLPTGSVKIHSDDPNPSTADSTVDLVTHIKGSAALGVCAESPAPPPDCVLTNDLNPVIDYGDVDYGTSAERVVALTNVGDGNLPIELTGVSLTSAAHFALTLFALVDDPAHPGSTIEQVATLPFFLSIGDPAASPPVPATQLRVHVRFAASGIDGDIPHESLVIDYNLTGSPTSIPIRGHINGCQPNGSDAGVPDGGADPQTDPFNCGACGVRCDTTVLHATTTCAAGVCGYSSCNANWGDCDVDYQNGCETDLRTTLAHCGACDSPCTNTHATGSVCSGGACTAPSCDSNWGNCDGDNKDGCETDLRITTDHCGTCATACTTPPGNGTTRCLGSMCTPTCVPNRSKDCDGDPVNGCETNIATDVNNCGDCHVVCDTSGGSTSCVGGVCKPGCNQGYGDCDGNPVNGCETNVLTDANNCGGCGASFLCSNNHMQTRTCTGGQCTGQCAAPYADCNNNKQSDGCEINTQTDPDNCGGCGVVCSANNMQTRTCVGGVCSGQCAAGFADCDGNKQTNGCEVNTQTDADNCGGCGASYQCSGVNMLTRTCTAGLCSGQCATGFADCNGNKLTDGCEINTQTDAANCGGCGAAFACSANHVTPHCTAGACDGACEAGGWTDCDNNKRATGCEINVNTDAGNCGGCGVSFACSSNHVTPHCAAGACDGACEAGGWTDCDTNKRTNGCEINVNTDASNCGGCGVTFACSSNHVTPHCTAGACDGACEAGGWTDCDASKRTNGCEINVNTDASNCGGCGGAFACSTNHVTAHCTAGQCDGACDSANGWADCINGKRTDGCETNVNSDANNCGGCGSAYKCSTNHVPTPHCSSGTCDGACDTANGWADCYNGKLTDGCETNINTDASNCGGCGVGFACSTNHVTAHCSAGQCDGICDSANGWTDCINGKRTDGCETNVNTDANNCGGCGSAYKCSTNHVPTPHCSSGTCDGACDTANGWADCYNGKLTDGCETQLTTDPDNCGGCGSAYACSHNHVPTPHCSSGTCDGACESGYDDCVNGRLADGCETSVTNNPTNCGSCGYVCADHAGPHVTGSSCSGTSCVVTGCDVTNRWYDMNGLWGDGCECQADTVPNVCSGAVNLSSGLAVNGTVSSPAGRNLTPAGDEDWYSVTFLTDGTCNFNPKITLVAGVLPIAIQVFTNCSSGVMNCKVAEGGNSSKANLVTWEMEYGATCGDKVVNGADPVPDQGLFINNSPPAGLPAALTFYVRVYPTGSSTTCLDYTITATN